MFKKILPILLLCFFNLLNAQQIELSPKAQISVLTVDPGPSLNDAFGHNAFRVKDPTHNIDQTFDYGRFDFEAPNFYLNFAKGKLNYSIGDTAFYDFLRLYSYYNRSVKEQVLNLSQPEKQTLYNYLLENNKPENRNYLYDFFYDNCATKIKDVANIAVNNQLEFNLPEDFKDASFRTLIQNNLNKNSWGSLGIDVALGAVIDKKARPEDHMFLPENIYKFFQNATIKGRGLPLVKESRVLYEQKPTLQSNAFFTSPLFIFGLFGLLIIWLTYKDYKTNKPRVWLNVTLFSLTGAIGVFILLLWFATDHTGTHQNYNLLWAFALNLLVIPQLYKKQTNIWFIKYLKFLIILLCLLTLHWIVGVQVFAIGLIPFLIALMIRYVFLVHYYK
ncbi:lipoprotein N-acyltransferase Lnb domain-containing protein [Snuella sedimenti]|uniref:DUF4105 domain-containing protein n=1 Tax=Snuella sedimenti TaxID=2798802 RepID=A0A8J7LN31_9FLAO|nr:DUF4105 domain-containing protein [Snuella sedimenti]MBJ6368289.1 DUF4105 domain-containing protein [Snuella sedimenti]